MAKSKPYRSVLSADLADEVLSISLRDGALRDAVDHPTPRTIGELLDQALEQLNAAVEVANEALESHKMAQLSAAMLAKSLKKRGNASIVVEPSGAVVLLVSYAQPMIQTEPADHVNKGKWSSELPTLDVLREQATELGVDIEDLGRRRKAIVDRLTTARSKLRHMDEVKVAPLPAQGPTNGKGHAEGEDGADQQPTTPTRGRPRRTS